MFRYFFDGNRIYDEPKGWENYVTVIQKDRTIRGIFQVQNADISFWGDGYAYLRNILDTRGYCALVDVRIESSCDNGKTWTYFLEGLIFINYCEFDEKNCMVTTKIDDNSFWSRIYNNKAIECLVSAGMSKNAVAIMPLTEYVLTMYDSAGGVVTSYGAGGDNAYRVYDIFKYLVRFMSDDTMDFISTYFDTGFGSRYFISSGQALITNAGNPLDLATFRKTFPKIDYATFFDEMNKRFNLGMIIEVSGGKPCLRVEENDYFYPSTPLLFNAEKLDGLKTKTALDYIYSNVSFGTTVIDDTVGAFPEDIAFVGFKEENYIVVGKCNLDKELNLVANYITSSNVIQEDLLTNYDDSFAGDLVIIDCENIDLVGHTADARMTNTLLGVPPPYYYNESLSNSECAKRYLGAIPNSIADYLGNGDNGFKAEIGSTVADNVLVTDTGYDTLIFPNEISDPNGNFNTATGEYTCPANGIYVFSVTANLAGFHLPDIGDHVIIELTIHNTTTATDYFLSFDHLRTDSQSQYVNQPTIICAAGDVITGEINIQPDGAMGGQTVKLMFTSSFACINSATGGGIYQEYNPADYPILQHEFDASMTEAEFNVIKNNPIGLIRFSRYNEVVRDGWIESLKYNHKKGIASFLLNTKR